MTPQRKRRLAIAGALTLVVAVAASCVFRGIIAPYGPEALAGGPAQIDRLRLPEGFRVQVFAAELEGARSLELGGEGTVFVGSRAAGNVYALRDTDGDGVSDERHVIASGLRSPNGVAFRDGDLYVAEISRVLRFAAIESRLDEPPEPEVIRDDLPDDEDHGWKFIAFGPDERLYVPVGAPCNVCEREDERYAALLRMNPDGSDLEIYAEGVRNTVGFDWHPETGELWFTDNGRDGMGDDVPPDELNHAPREGLHFGFPYCHGRIPDPEIEGKTCAETVAPEVTFAAHVAALGMRFYDHEAFGARYRHGAFVAQHGSWDRDDPVGYRIVFVPFEGGMPSGEPEPFAEGWLDGLISWGRPVDVLVLEDGSLLVSDDKSDAVYRIARRGSAS